MFDLAKGKEVRRETVIMITTTVINKGSHFKGKKTLICSKKKLKKIHKTLPKATLGAPRQKKLPK